MARPDTPARDPEAATAAANDDWAPPDQAPWCAHPSREVRRQRQRERRLRYLRIAAVCAAAIAATIMLTGEAAPQTINKQPGRIYFVR